MNANILLKDYCPAIAERGGIASADIIDLNLEAIDIKDGAITEKKIADGAVTAEKLADGLVVDVGANSIETAMIQNGAVNSDKLASDAVVEAKIADSAVSEGKLAFIPIKVIKGQITHDGGASQEIATIPAGTLLLKALAICDEAFDGDTPAPTLDIGFVGAPASILPTPDLTLNAITGEDPSELGGLLWDNVGSLPLIHYFGAEQVVTATCNFDPAISAGNLKVYLIVAQLDPIAVP